MDKEQERDKDTILKAVRAFKKVATTPTAFKSYKYASGAAGIWIAFSLAISGLYASSVDGNFESRLNALTDRDFKVDSLNKNSCAYVEPHQEWQFTYTESKGDAFSELFRAMMPIISAKGSTAYDMGRAPSLKLAPCAILADHIVKFDTAGAADEFEKRAAHNFKNSPHANNLRAKLTESGRAGKFSFRKVPIVSPQ